MFNYDYEAGDVFQMLYIEKLLYDHDRKPSGIGLDVDFFYESFWEAMDQCAECVERYVKGTEYETITFSDPCITEYYRLCNEYGKQKHIRYKDNPYVKKALAAVREEMNDIGSYCYNWALCYSPKKSYTNRLEFYFDYEFYEYADAIESILCALDFFKTGIKELKVELGITKFSIVTSAKQIKTLKGAA